MVINKWVACGIVTLCEVAMFAMGCKIGRQVERKAQKEKQKLNEKATKLAEECGKESKESL